MKRDPMAKAQEPSRSEAHTPGATSFPHYSGHKLRRMAASGLGEAGAMAAEVTRMMRVDPDADDPRARPTPHVVDIDDVTRGLGLEAADEQRVQRLVTDTSVAYSQKTQTPRMLHARGRLVSTMRDAMRHIPADARDEVVRRASVFWKRNNQTDYGRVPTVRFEGARSVAKSMTLVVPMGEPLEKGEARGGKYLSRRPDGHGGWIYSYAEAHGEGAERVKIPTRRESFEIATRDGKETREGVQLGDYAMHREKGYGGMQYKITHKPSGMSAESSFSRVEAEAMLHNLGTHGNGHDGTNAGVRGVMSTRDKFSHDFGADVRDASKHNHHDNADVGGKKWIRDRAAAAAKVEKSLLLEKGEARGGKYFKRIPTGNPKHPWRYFYHEGEYQAWLREKHVGGTEAAEKRRGQLGFDFAPAPPPATAPAPQRPPEPVHADPAHERHIEPAIIPVWAEMAKHAADDALARNDNHLVRGLLARIPPLLEGIGPGKARSWLEEKVLGPLRAAAAKHDAEDSRLRATAEASRPEPADHHGIEATGTTHVVASTGVETQAPAKGAPKGGFRTPEGTKQRGLEHAEKLASFIRENGIERVKVWTKEGYGVRVYLPGNQYLAIGNDGTVSATDRGRQVFSPDALWPKHAAAVKEARAKHKQWHEGSLAADPSDPFTEFEEHAEKPKSSASIIGGALLRQATEAMEAKDYKTANALAERITHLLANGAHDGVVDDEASLRRAWKKLNPGSTDQDVADAIDLARGIRPKEAQAAPAAPVDAGPWKGTPKQVEYAQTFLDYHKERISDARLLVQHGDYDVEIKHDAMSALDAGEAALDAVRDARAVLDGRDNLIRMRSHLERNSGSKLPAAERESWERLDSTLTALHSDLQWLGWLREGKVKVSASGKGFSTKSGAPVGTIPASLRPVLAATGLLPASGPTPTVPGKRKERIEESDEPVRVRPKLGKEQLADAVNPKPPKVTPAGTLSMEKVNALPVGSVIVSKNDNAVAWRKVADGKMGWERQKPTATSPDGWDRMPDTRPFSAFGSIVREVNDGGGVVVAAPKPASTAEARAAAAEAGEAADQTSMRLFAEGARGVTAALHRVAAGKHRDAAEQFRAIGNEPRVQRHEEAAADHEQEAANYEKKEAAAKPAPVKETVVDKTPPGGWSDRDKVPESYQESFEAQRQAREARKKRFLSLDFEAGQTLKVNGKRYRVVRSMDMGRFGRVTMLTPLDGKARSPREIQVYASGQAILRVAGQGGSGEEVATLEGGTERAEPWAPPAPAAPPPPPKPTEPTDKRPAVPMPPKAPEGTPRGDAEKATKAAKESGAFVNDRSSIVEQRGEDVGNSARHKALVWKSLRDATGSENAEQLFTRDFLERQEPVEFVTRAQQLVAEGNGAQTLRVLLGHLALRKFPAKPEIPKHVGQGAGSMKSYYRGKEFVQEYGYTRPSSDDPPESQEHHLKMQREAYYAAWGTARKLVSEFIEKESSATSVVEDMRALASRVREEYTKSRNEYGSRSAGTKALADLHNALIKRSTLSPLGQANDFATRLSKRYPAPSERAARVHEHVLRVLEGDSMNAAFDEKKESAKDIDLSTLYNTAKMTRKGPASRFKDVKQGLDILDASAGGDFGMRGVQWGKSVTDSERVHHLKSVIDSFDDLTDVLGLPKGMASFNGRLAVAIGARGKGTASAHYETGSRVINLTRAKGAGALAHEWGHMFDNLLFAAAGQSTLTKTDARFVSEIRNAVDDPTFAAMDTVMASDAMAKFRQRLNADVDTAVKNRELAEKKGVYWKSTREVWARVFERYVQRKLRLAGRENTYLSGLTAKSDGSPAHPFWPDDAEVDAMTPHIDEVFKAFAKSTLLHKAFSDLLSRPRVDPRYSALVKGRLVVPMGPR